jgi:hypothetical protein
MEMNSAIASNIVTSVQGLKPGRYFAPLAARLKPCPDTKPTAEEMHDEGYGL